MDGRHPEEHRDAVAADRFDGPAVACRREFRKLDYLRKQLSLRFRIDESVVLGGDRHPHREHRDRLPDLVRIRFTRWFRDELRRRRTILLDHHLETRILLEDPPLYVTKSSARLDAKLAHQEPSRVLVDLERLGLAVRAVEGEHQSRAETLA